MTLFHVFALVFYVLTVIVVSKLFGIPVYVTAVLCAICVGIAYASFSFYRRRFAYPMCQTPKCGSRSFKSIGWAKEMKIAEAGVVLECSKCGKRYLKTETAFVPVVLSD